MNSSCYFLIHHTGTQYEYFVFKTVIEYYSGSTLSGIGE
ncbi:Hypothetical protein ADU72_1770 [Pediococcus damnosus]|uniref:Uncharacterized protein n=1 Tax=Pediococcus damnosus TaxID=51663 RepID=A0AAC9B1A5_9LACO|nr:Hypothetical protein ADU70_0946 [Pediococcus damnosus]AMV67695.1 Hypothetical protein ADU72_1770 [Pediococcus damnosus]